MNWYFRILNWLHKPFVKPGEKDPYHAVFPLFQKMVGEMREPVVLELGSRNVTGVTRRHLFPAAKQYIGFDIHPGDAVDVVGDAHELSKHFAPNSVDAIFSASVFEHLVFPWKAVLEINRVLKPGGLCYVSTHPCWPAHELPWDFWRYPIGGLSHLFLKELGFEMVSITEGLPCKPYSLVTDPPTRPFYTQQLNLGIAAIARKVGDYDPERFKWDVKVSEAVKTEYPRP